MSWSKSEKMVRAYKALVLGMPKVDVIGKLGKPDSQRLVNGVETLGWSSSEFRGLLRGGTIERKMYCEFANDILVGFDGSNMSHSRA
ncbi:hypothetical protein FACS189499_03790 [Clostridia bacterium]|nr:hypothetical protein FACS189499_03790 [Clostridia bacterium]